MFYVFILLLLLSFVSKIFWANVCINKSYYLV